MKKILIIGSGGAGKSTLAKRLSEILNIEVIHLDSLYWQAGWVEPPKPVWRQQVEELLARDSWIMDGNYSGTLDIRIAACDTVIFLDLGPMICLWRVLKRLVQYRNQTRPDMATGCEEKFNLEFLAWIWNYRRRSRPKVVRLLEQKAPNRQVIWLRSQSAVERFLSSAKEENLGKSAAKR